MEEVKSYMVMATTGMVSEEIISFKTLKEAEEFAEAYDWQCEDENGFVWDMEIFESDEVVCYEEEF